MIHFLLKSIVPSREQVNGTDQLLLRVIEPDIGQDRRRCIRNTEYRDAADDTTLLAEPLVSMPAGA